LCLSGSGYAIRECGFRGAASNNCRFVSGYPVSAVRLDIMRQRRARIVLISDVNQTFPLINIKARIGDLAHHAGASLRATAESRFQLQVGIGSIRFQFF